MSGIESQKDAVLLRINESIAQEDHQVFARHLSNFGFSGIAFDPSSAVDFPDGVNATQPANSNGAQGAEALSTHMQLIADGQQPAAEDLWACYQSIAADAPATELDLSISTQENHGSVALMVQMSLPLIPIVNIGRPLMRLPVDHSHYLRSLIFWRNRNNIAHMEPRLVYAGEDGSLVYIFGSWMVALNWNQDEISIDVGDTGAMWLMLGTHRDVHLHGSVLVLPAYSGAIMANELAR